MPKFTTDDLNNWLAGSSPIDLERYIKIKEGEKMYKIKIYFKDGFRITYDAQNYYSGDDQFEIIVNDKQTIFINTRETTVISIIKAGDK